MLPGRVALAIQVFIPLVLLIVTAPSALAQHECEFGGPVAAEKLENALNNANSCKEAAALFNECRWGSSADSSFGAIAVLRCEKDFYKKLTAVQQKHYADAMQLCAYEYARQRGTMYISEAAACQVDLAASVASDRHLADKPVPAASFDCALARSPLEMAICADVSLGRADVVLGRVYTGELKFLKGQDRASFIENEKKWLKAIPVQCGLSESAPSRKTLNCLRNAFEIRFSSLEGCANEELSICLNPDFDPELYRESQADDDAAPRASFDCDAPSTAVQVVICADHDLGQKDLQVAHALEAATAGLAPAARDAVEESQQKWLQFVGSSCPLGVVGGVPDILTRGCIRSAYEVRAKQLDSCVKDTGSNLAWCLSSFKIIAD